MTNLKKYHEKIGELTAVYEDLKDEINHERADGSLSKLVNLKNEFDETFDFFFDDEELRKKYESWNYEEDCICTEKSNSDLLKELDKIDLERYIEFLESYIDELEFELKELKKPFCEEISLY